MAWMAIQGRCLVSFLLGGCDASQSGSNQGHACQSEGVQSGGGLRGLSAGECEARDGGWFQDDNRGVCVVYEEEG
jgi:hypothetical protein